MSSETGEAEWTKENIQRLLAAMKTHTPKRDRRSSYTKAMGSINWFHVAFPPFSPRACQEKWTEILQKIRKTRTLTELIVDAEDGLSNPDQNNKIQPALPQRPGSPSTIFYEENWAMFHEQNPKMNSKTLLQLLAQKYTALPDEEKAQYVEKHRLETEEYERRIYSKRKRGSGDTLNNKRHTEDGLPPKPPVNGYNLFCQEQVAFMAGIKANAYVSEWAQRWRDLTETQKKEYSKRCSELRREYMIKLDKYVKTLDVKEQQRIRNKHSKLAKAITREDRHAKKLPGEPKTPSRNGHVIFCQDQMELLKKKYPDSRERFAQAYKLWRGLSQKEKNLYKQKAKQNTRKYAIELQKWLETLTPAEQQEYMKRNRRKRIHVDEEEPDVNDAAEGSHRPSDSEDEDIEDSSSDEEEAVKSLLCTVKDFEEDEEDEEEEEGDITFDMY